MESDRENFTKDTNKQNGEKYINNFSLKKIISKKMKISILGFAIMFFSVIGLVVTFKSIYVNEAYLSTNTLYIGDTPI